MSDKAEAKQLLCGALRQYKHNNGSYGFVFGYDAEMTESLVNELLIKCTHQAAETRREVIEKVKRLERFGWAGEFGMGNYSDGNWVRYDDVIRSLSTKEGE